MRRGWDSFYTYWTVIFMINTLSLMRSISYAIIYQVLTHFKYVYFYSTMYVLLVGDIRKLRFQGLSALMIHL